MRCEEGGRLIFTDDAFIYSFSVFILFSFSQTIVQQRIRIIIIKEKSIILLSLTTNTYTHIHTHDVDLHILNLYLWLFSASKILWVSYTDCINKERNEKKNCCESIYSEKWRENILFYHKFNVPHNVARRSTQASVNFLKTCVSERWKKYEKNLVKNTKISHRSSSRRKREKKRCKL